MPAGTEKVRQAQDSGQLHVVNPDWLWSCLERWDKVEERLFPLRGDPAKSQRWAPAGGGRWLRGRVRAGAHTAAAPARETPPPPLRRLS